LVPFFPSFKQKNPAARQDFHKKRIKTRPWQSAQAQFLLQFATNLAGISVPT
jgi:hypothetical protein